MIDQVLHERYHIQSLLGRKTGRRTFLANDLETRSPVVIKLLLFGPDFVWDDLKLFEREAETLKSLDHPAIPKYLDFFEVETELGKGFALVQSYIEAQSLQRWVETGRTFSEEDLKTIATDLLEILDYLHTRQPPLIHRDIKPSNILLGDRSGNHPGQVYLVDFGSVQTTGHGGTVTIVGTYGYMPPEQFGGRAFPASDLYGVGATLIYLSTSQHPGDLPQTDLYIDFESLTTLSYSFVRWIRWLTEPSLSKRPTSAKAAIQRFHQPPTRGNTVSTQRFSLNTRRPSSEIQLEATPTQLEIRVPRDQLENGSLKHGSSMAGCLGAVGVFCLFYVLFSGSAGMGFWILLPALWILFQSIRMEARKNQILSYSLVFKVEGEDGITLSVLPNSYKSVISDILNSASENSTSENSTSDRLTSERLTKLKTSVVLRNSHQTKVLYQEKLRSISAGPYSVPKYCINFDCQALNNMICVTGNRAEIQWLCDELNEWSGLSIKYYDASLSA